MQTVKGFVALFGAELREQLRDTAYSAWTIVLPLLLAVICRLVIGSAAGEAALPALGMIASGSLALSGIMNGPLARQQREEAGLYRRIRLTPISPNLVSLAAALANATLSFPATLAAWGVAWLLGLRTGLGAGSLIAWMSVLWICTTGLGVGLGKLVTSFMQLKTIGNLVYLYLIGTAGIFFDISSGFGVALHIPNPVWWWMQWGASLLASKQAFLGGSLVIPGLLLAVGLVGLALVPTRKQNSDSPAPMRHGNPSAARGSQSPTGDRPHRTNRAPRAHGAVAGLLRVGMLAVRKEPLMSALELALTPGIVLLSALAGHAHSLGLGLIFIGTATGFSVAVAWDLARLRQTGVLKRLRCSPAIPLEILAGTLGIPVLMVAIGGVLGAAILMLVDQSSWLGSLIVLGLGACGGIGAGLAAQAKIRNPVVLVTWIPFVIGALFLWTLIVQQFALPGWALFANPISSVLACIREFSLVAAALSGTWMILILLFGVGTATRDLQSN